MVWVWNKRTCDNRYIHENKQPYHIMRNVWKRKKLCGEHSDSQNCKNRRYCLFSDFKQDDSFEFLRKCPRYYPYDRTIEALEIVYDTLHKRQSGEDISRSPVTLVWDEYMANILAIQGTEKKKADDIMRKVSEILMLGRSLGVRLVISCQRPDAAAFPSGSRLNYGVILIVGAPIRSIYEMLIPKEYIDEIGDRNFKRGEGVALLQGSELCFIKIPRVRDMERCNESVLMHLPEKKAPLRAAAKPQALKRSASITRP